VIDCWFWQVGIRRWLWLASETEDSVLPGCTDIFLAAIRFWREPRDLLAMQTGRPRELAPFVLTGRVGIQRQDDPVH
jgi:hypothetical protein